MHACIVADGGAPDRRALDESWPGWADDVALVIAADGGARSAAALGLAIDLVVGDLDSLAPEDVRRLAADGIPFERVSPAKDETDTELALIAARDRGASRITILCAMGGERLDHALANVLLLAHPVVADCEARLLDPGGRVSLLRAPGPDGAPVTRDLAGPPGALVSLIPLGVDAERVTTEGLAYPLHLETLPVGPARGCSNVRTAERARVTLGAGLLLVVESPARLAA